MQSAITRTLCCLLALCGAAAPALGQPAQPFPGEGHVQLRLDLQGLRDAVTGVAFSPDEKHVAACGGKEVRIWDLQTGQLHYTLRGQIDAGTFGNCLALAYSPDNCFLVVGIDNHTPWGSIRVYDTHNFSEIKELLPGHERPVTRLAFSPDSRYLAAADSSGEIAIFDWPLRRIVARANVADHANGQFTAFSFPSGENVLLVRGRTESAVIAVPSGRVLATRRHIPANLAGWLDSHAAALQALGNTACFDLRLASSAWLAAGSAPSGAAQASWVACFDVAGSRPRCIYRGHGRTATCVALSRSGKLAASAEPSGAVHVWDATTGQSLHLLKNLGQPCYRAAYDPALRAIGIAPAPLTGPAWGYNSCGRIDRVFDLNRRAVAGLPQGASFPAELVAHQPGRIDLTRAADRQVLQFTGANRLSAAIGLSANAAPTCYTLLRTPQLGVANAVIVGDTLGRLLCYDPATRQLRRRFAGHGGFITSISESADGRLLTSSSADGTICLWRLDQPLSAAWVDFETAGDLVTVVPAGSYSERAGIRVGDRFVSFAGRSLADIRAAHHAGNFPYQPGQRVVVGLARGSASYQTEIILVPGQDVVEPLLTMMMTSRHEWILWTPQGYYEASPGAGDIVGLHVNRGPQHSAQFLPLHQFRRQLYRPDIIDQVFQTASVSQALAAANAELQDPPPAIDLRQSQDLERWSPPQVRILSPVAGSVTSEAQVHVLAEVVSQDGNPIGDVRLLVNGRPAVAKGALVVGEGGEPRSRHSLQQTVSLLPGENTISLLATNAQATSVPATVTITYQAPADEFKRQPKLHLLSIGVSEYAQQRLNLRYAHLDARDFARSWDSQRGRLYSDVATNLLTNQDATSPRIRDAMRDLLAAVDRRDVAVIFISAHGVRDDQLEYYLGTHEIDRKNLAATGVHFREVQQLLEQLPCKVLMFVDTCHAGGITGAKSIASDPLYELTSDEYGAIVFASSLPREIAIEDEEWGHGAFTAAILETFGDGASDLNGDGYLSLTEMEHRVYDRVQKLTDGLQHPVMCRPATVPNLRFFQLPPRQSLTAR